MTVQFKFSPDDKVETKLGDIGIIDYVARSKMPINQYSVKMKGGDSNWYYEDDLTLYKEK